ncbi:MAG: hypothetical protein ACLFQV_07360, partial [Vulcanimicrobiota bacterium]
MRITPQKVNNRLINLGGQRKKVEKGCPGLNNPASETPDKLVRGYSSPPGLKKLTILHTNDLHGQA